MKKVEFQMAEIKDIKDIMEFIKLEWSEKHVLAKSRKLFKYFYCTEDNKVNFVLARDKESGAICAIHGYRCCSAKKGYQDYFGALWKAKRTSNPMLGIALKKFLFQVVEPRSFSGVGANPNSTIPIMSQLGYFVGKLEHYYRLSDREQYNVCKVQNKCILSINSVQNYELQLFETFEELLAVYDFEQNIEKRPFKDAEYIKHAYYENLGYQYKVYGLKHVKDKIHSLLIGRFIDINHSRVFRIVDFIGIQEELSFTGEVFDQLMQNNNCEYADFYCAGMQEEVLNKFGMIKKEGESNVIPNYFEPFVQSNVDIFYFCNKEDNTMVICKGDADQDRPNIITWEE